MNTFKQKIVFCICLILLLGQQAVYADDRSHSHRQPQSKRWQKSHVPRKPQVDYRFDRRREYRPPTYRHYYKPGHRVGPLPYGYNRVMVNASEYFFFEGYFYRPSISGYVVVDAPIGAIVATLPLLHHLIHWHGQPYFIVGNAFYRKHPRGYIVVPDPGYGYRR